MSNEHPNVPGIMSPTSLAADLVVALPATGDADLNLTTVILKQDPGLEQQMVDEALQVDDGNTSIHRRTKFGTYSIVFALYLVLFVAALDQTIIA